MSTESVMLSKHLILCCPLVLCHQFFPALGLSQCVSSFYQLAKFTFSVSPSNEYSGLIFFRIDGLISLLSKWLSRVFSRTTIWTHQLFGTQLSLWSNSHIQTWLLEPYIWQCGPLFPKWYHCSLMLCLVLTHFFCSKEQESFNFMAAVTVCNDFGAQENKICHCFLLFPFY